ncbi:hypothetical protein J3R82DRAFT_5597 [Butyriboletus roseoflavus]|nr:hypothetical protein J3R82DRAFT_5597 [Butyriboletus roseoflavus]
MSPVVSSFRFLVSCMLSLPTLVYISSFLFFFVLPLAILYRFCKTPTQVPEKNCLKPYLPETPSSSQQGLVLMPSTFYQPPMKVLEGLNHTEPSHVTKEPLRTNPQVEIVGVKQPYDAFLVLDVEATCFQGTGFEWPNEIIEWPVCLLRWKDKSLKRRAGRLEIVSEFRSFVKPTWKPQLSQFCTDLTGITQDQVDYAPTFPKVLKMFARFLAQYGLIDPKNGRPLQRFCWCSDGPFDVRDFVVKQCFISNVGILKPNAKFNPISTATMSLLV